MFGLDVLRTIAVLIVILYHFPFPPSQSILRFTFYRSWIGVDLFFVLSGFLIGGQFFSSIQKGQPTSYGRFLIRRLLRTLPNYLVMLLVVYELWPGSPFGEAV